MGLAILIVDDSKVSRMMLRKELPPGEYTIREASCGEECLRLYKELKADLVFLDKTMPGLDGLEVFGLLKEVDPQVKVVMVSADVQASVQDEARRLGIMRFISKPITMDALRSVLEECGG